MITRAQGGIKPSRAVVLVLVHQDGSPLPIQQHCNSSSIEFKIKSENRSPTITIGVGLLLLCQHDDAFHGLFFFVPVGPKSTLTGKRKEALFPFAIYTKPKTSSAPTIPYSSQQIARATRIVSANNIWKKQVGPWLAEIRGGEPSSEQHCFSTIATMPVGKKVFSNFDRRE
jgi:hypothetical protein